MQVAASSQVLVHNRAAVIAARFYGKSVFCRRPAADFPVVNSTPLILRVNELCDMACKIDTSAGRIQCIEIVVPS